MQLKSRVWYSIENRFLEEDSYFIDSNGIFYLAVKVYTDNSGNPLFDLIRCSDSRYIVSYSTGITDKKGQELYTDDIVCMFGRKQLSGIFFEDGCFQIYAQPTGHHPAQRCLLINHIDVIEKVGNIYQNTELTEAK